MTCPYRNCKSSPRTCGAETPEDGEVGICETDCRYVVETKAEVARLTSEVERLTTALRRTKSMAETCLYTPPEAKHAREEMLLRIVETALGIEGGKR